jgi:hypothetical protein
MAVFISHHITIHNTGLDQPLLRLGVGPISKHVHVHERTNILVMDLEEIDAKNNCAGEGQQQFNRPTDCKVAYTSYDVPCFIL